MSWAGEIPAAFHSHDEEVQMSRLLKPKAVAAQLGVSPYTLLEWRRDGFGPPFLRLRGNDLRYPEEKLKEWVSERMAHSLTEERARGDRLNGAAEDGGFK
jgi:predicted DNA-binding transcriptional regulator AlpA